MTADDFLNQFGHFADAPNGIKKLRELILQLAVRGKLVDQYPNDEPASELIKKIEAEKAKLIAEGKIKKQKPLPPINPDEIPYELPKGWEWVRLGDAVLHMDAGWSPQCHDDPTNSSKEWGVLKTTAVQDWLFMPEAHKRLPAGLSPRPEYEVADGDILITRAGPKHRVGICCHVPQCRPRLMLSDKIIRFHMVIPDMMPRFVALCFNAGFSRDYIDQQKSGMAVSQMNISQQKLSSAPIPLVSLAEQKRIVAKVDQLMKLCDELEARQQERNTARISLNNSCLNALTAPEEDQDKAWSRISNNFNLLYDTPETVAELRKSILQLAVMGKLVPQDSKDEPASELLKKIEAEKTKLVKEGKIKKPKPLPPINPDDMPYELPNGWEWVRIGSLGFSFQNGLSKRTGTSGNEVVVLRLADIQHGRVSTSDYRTIRVTEAEIERYSVKAADILVTRVNGSIDLVGSFNLVTQGQGHCYCDHFVRMRTLSDMVSMPFVELYGRSWVCRDQIEAKFITTAGQKTVNQGHLSSLSLPLPPLGEQERIVEKVDTLMTLCDQLEAKLKQSQSDSESLTASIVNHLTEAA